MLSQFSRTAFLLGEDGVERLRNCRVAVFGIGGVGGYAVEALARSGIGTLDLIDSDTVCLSNLNRQIIATRKTIGKPKVEAAKERILEINPDAVVHTYQTFYLPETAEQFDFTKYDYVVDAIDTVTGKIQLVCEAERVGTPIISSMGAGNKLDPTAFRVADIYETSVCPLAKVMRRELKKRGIAKLKVVYSKEEAMTPLMEEEPEEVSAGNESESAIPRPAKRRQTPGSVAFIPSVVGLIMAGEVIKDLTADTKSAKKKK